MKEVRCTSCKKLLAKAEGGQLQIKCPRCKTLNTIATELPTRTPRASCMKRNTHADTQTDRLS